MPDIDQNITVDVTGNTAAIATDYTTIGVTNAHVQITKLSFGDTTTATRVTTTSPLPVDIRASNASVGITGGVYGIGNFKIINGLSGITAVPLVVSGTTASDTIPVQISGRVQGFTTGTPVAITGSVSINSGASIQGTVSGYPVTVTGGRVLSYTTDSVTVSGTVGVSGGRYLLQSTDGVRIYGASNGETMIPVTLRDGSGNSVGSSGGALNVNIVGTGVTATVTINPVVGVCQAYPTVPFYVAGATAGPAVRIQGSYNSSTAVEVGWTGTQYVNVSNTVGVNAANITTGISGVTAVNSINTNTASIPTIYSSLVGATGVNAQIVGFTRPGSVYTGNISVGLTGTTLGSQSLKTGITLKVVNNNMLVYGSGSTGGYLMSSGDVLFVETNNLNNLTFQTTVGSATLYYIAT